MLYLVATPIGNLSDFSLRAIEILKTSDYILCEDTRHSRILLNHFQITTPLRSYHQFNEMSVQETIVLDLKAGLTIALISDAGTPGISDPGERLVKKCVELDLQISSIPGPCAAISALICSGFSTSPFQFIGFLPTQLSEKKEVLRQLASYHGTSILYESPHRLATLLETLCTIMPERRICLARELTKKFETFYNGTASQLHAKFSLESVKGECVVVIEGAMQTDSWETLSIEEHVLQMMQTYQLSKKEAIQAVAKLRHIPKKLVYKETISDEE